MTAGHMHPWRSNRGEPTPWQLKEWMERVRSGGWRYADICRYLAGRYGWDAATIEERIQEGGERC